ncbi:MAG: hypothetical protein L6Q97_01535 [Thermoanaerobaculia bacterium]|nr:hypothetical protein [Thermoanaerobaculia bacterium]
MNSGSIHKSDRLRILVLGYIVRGPIGGMAWHHLQYVLGLQRLGHEVYYLEDSGDTPYCCYDPIRGVTDENPAYGLQFAAAVFQKTGLSQQWAYYDRHLDTWHGSLAGRIRMVLAGADLLLNLSCSNPIRPWLAGIPVRALIDTDPVFTQIRNLTDPARRELSEAHNAFFTFGENISQPACHIPDDGFPWQPTRQPVVLDAWPVTAGQALGKFTTVMQWESYPGREYNGRYFGQKSDAFPAYFGLPLRTGQVFELAVGSLSAPRATLREHGWQLCNPLDVTRDPWTYQQYLQNSKAEFSIAKHGYVEACTGWFSERSAAYLASGRPVVVQDTGFSQWLGAGEGVLAFRDPAEALANVEQVNRDYERQCRAAREICEAYFESAGVLNRLIELAIAGSRATATLSFSKF